VKLITIIIGNLTTLKAVSTSAICTFAKLFIVPKLRVELNCTHRALFNETIRRELLWWTVYENCDLQHGFYYRCMRVSGQPAGILFLL